MTRTIHSTLPTRALLKRSRSKKTHGQVAIDREGASWQRQEGINYTCTFCGRRMLGTGWRQEGTTKRAGGARYACDAHLDDKPERGMTHDL